VIPKVDVLLGGSFRSSPGPALSANEVIPNAVVAPSFWRRRLAYRNVRVLAEVVRRTFKDALALARESGSY
jgi:hypothetical protein